MILISAIILISEFSDFNFQFISAIDDKFVTVRSIWKKANQIID